MNETIVSNMPTAALWIIAVALVVFAVSSLMIAVAAMSVFGSLSKLIADLSSLVKETENHLPRLVDSLGQREDKKPASQTID